MNETSHPDPQSRERVHALIVWAIVLLLTVVSAASQYRNSQLAVQPSTGAGPTSELLTNGRLIVGLHQAHQSAPSLVPKSTLDEHLSTLRATIGNQAADQVRLAILLGEVRGGEAALELLDRIETTAPSIAQDLETLRPIYQTQKPPSPDDRQRLIMRHGWFGHLALAYQQPPGNTHRAQAISAAKRTMWTLTGGTLLVVLAGLVGLALFILGLVLHFTGRLTWLYRPRGGGTLPFLETLALFLLVMLVISELSQGLAQILPGIEILLLPALLLGVPLTLLWPLLRGVRWAELCAGLGWQRGAGVGREAGFGLIGYLAGLPVTAAGVGATMLLAQFSGEDASHPTVEQLRGGDPVVLILILGLTVVWAPLVEESLFRGAAYHHLRRGWSALLAATFTGLLFAVIHPQGWVAVPALAALGGVLCYIREWRGSVIGSMAAHALHNGVAISFYFLLMG